MEKIKTWQERMAAYYAPGGSLRIKGDVFFKDEEIADLRAALAKAEAAPVGADERAAFEKRFGPNNGFAWRDQDDKYKSAALQGAWEVWQAAVAQRGGSGEAKLTASTDCPVCGIGTPHRHADADVYRWLEAQAGRFLADGVIILSKREYEQPALICQGQPDGNHGNYMVAKQAGAFVPSGAKLYYHPAPPPQPDSGRDAALEEAAKICENLCYYQDREAGVDGNLHDAAAEIRAAMTAQQGEKGGNHG